MDCSVGCSEIQMALANQEATMFRTSKDVFCYKVMPFGLKNVGATYQREMQTIFKDILQKIGMLCG